MRRLRYGANSYRAWFTQWAARAAASGILALSGCSGDGAVTQNSSGDTDGQGSAGRSGTGVGGERANGGSNSSRGGSGGSGVGGSAGASPNAEPIKVHVSWSTSELMGTTLTPKECYELGADTVGFQLTGDTLETQQNLYSQNDDQCAAGARDWDWTFGAGDFRLFIGLWKGTFNNGVSPIVGSGMPFTIPPEGGDVVLPELKIVFGTFLLQWSIQKASATATCAEVGAEHVEIELEQHIGDFGSITKTWSTSCNQESPLSPPLAPGRYSLTARLRDSANTVLATWEGPPEFVVTTTSAPTFPPMAFIVP